MELLELKTAIDEYQAANTDALQETRKDVAALNAHLDKLETRMNRPGGLPRGGRASDLKRYSVARAIRLADAGRLDGVEGEMHTELSRGRDARGVLVPVQVLLGERKSQLVTPDGSGGYTVGTTLGSVADRFRPALKVEALGATVLRGLTGFVDLPNLAGSGSTHWIAEHHDTVRSSVAFEKVTLSPKTVSAEYEFSRRLMLQSQESIEQLLRRDLGFLLAQAIDAAALKNRSGGVNEPLGILDPVWGVQKITTETLLSDTAANALAALEMDDVSGTGGFLTSPKVLQAARKTKDKDDHVIPISELFHGVPVVVTTQCPDTIGSGSNKSALIYGLWSELVVGYWSAVDILLNRYHQDVASKGGALLHAFLDVDVAVRHPQAFCYAEI